MSLWLQSYLLQEVPPTPELIRPLDSSTGPLPGSHSPVVLECEAGVSLRPGPVFSVALPPTTPSPPQRPDCLHPVAWGEAAGQDGSNEWKQRGRSFLQGHLSDAGWLTRGNKKDAYRIGLV